MSIEAVAELVPCEAARLGRVTRAVSVRDFWNAKTSSINSLYNIIAHASFLVCHAIVIGGDLQVHYHRFW
jgi:hypothetical protein